MDDGDPADPADSADHSDSDPVDSADSDPADSSDGDPEERVDADRFDVERFDADCLDVERPDADRLDAVLADHLDAEPRPRTVTALPDGSVDCYYDAYGDRAERIATAAAFGERVGGDADSVRLSRTARRPGGQAVTMACQARALGDDAALFGHLDDPAFDDLDVEAYSMGEPGAVHVLEFDDEEVLLAHTSADVADWSLADLESVADDPQTVLTPDAICWGNWISVEGSSGTFRTLADRSLDGGWLVLDPGDLGAADPGRVRDLADALARLSDAYDVVVSANRRELAAAVEAFDRTAGSADRGDETGNDVDGSDDSDDADDSDDSDDAEEDIDDADDPEIVAAVRARTAATAVVMHAERVAVAATPEGVYRVPNYEVREATRSTGAGDCFTAALAHALARDRAWPAALGLANLAAAHRVETGEVGDRETLRAFLRSHDVRT